MDSKEIINKLEVRYDVLASKFDNAQDTNISRANKKQLAILNQMAKLAQEILEMRAKYGEERDVYAENKREMRDWLDSVKSLVTKLGETLPQSLQNKTLDQLEESRRTGQNLIKEFYISHSGFN